MLPSALQNSKYYTQNFTANTVSFVSCYGTETEQIIKTECPWKHSVLEMVLIQRETTRGCRKQQHEEHQYSTVHRSSNQSVLLLRHT